MPSIGNRAGMSPYVHAPTSPSIEPHNQSSLRVVLPKGASSTQIYGLGQNQDRANICESMHL